MPARVCFTMDNLGDAADLYRGVINKPRGPGENPAFDTGYPALLEMFARHRIPITYFVEGWSARQYPREMERILSHGNDVGMHGWTHERWSELSDGEITELAGLATESIRANTGRPPSAFRAPGGFSTTHTRKVLRELGYNVDASLTETGAITTRADGFTCLPYQWVGVDATHWLWNRRDCEEVETIWQSALLNAAHHDQHLIFIWHPHVMGIVPERLAVGERIIRFVLEDPRFEVFTLQSLRKHALEHFSPDDTE